MGLGKTFTRAIVREIGRNYGKAASNHLLGDKHSKLLNWNLDACERLIGTSVKVLISR